MLQFLCRVAPHHPPRTLRGVGELQGESAHWICSSGHWKGNVLKKFLTTWLVLTDVLGNMQNCDLSPWVQITISWGNCKKYCGCCLTPSDSELIGLGGVWAWGFLKAPQTLRITELSENRSEPLVSMGKRPWRQHPHLLSTQACRMLLPPEAPGSLDRLSFSPWITLRKVNQLSTKHKSESVPPCPKALFFLLSFKEIGSTSLLDSTDSVKCNLD